MNKYRAQRTEVDGISFASKREPLGGGISVKIFDYYADFAYTDRDTGRRIIEDSKGVRTAVYKLKKKGIIYQSHILTLTFLGRSFTVESHYKRTDHEQESTGKEPPQGDDSHRIDRDVPGRYSGGKVVCQAPLAGRSVLPALRLL